MDTEAQHAERDRSSRPSDSEQPSDSDGPEERSRSAFTGRITDWVPGGRITVTLLVLLLFLLLLSTFVLRPFQIPSGSMERGLRIGDRVLVNKLAYRFDGRPQRGDIVVFDGTGLFGDGDYIKRVVGVGGDHVVCCDEEGRVRVNGQSVDESAFLYPGDRPSTVPFDVVVPDGTLFVLGDHRADSSDSRDHLGSPGGGMVPLDEVIGRADWIVWPFGHATHLDRPDAYARVPDAESGAGAAKSRAAEPTVSGAEPTPAGAEPTPAGAGAARSGTGAGRAGDADG
ncbi:signal peptidase I [Streptomyces coelicoflavus]|uniref:signal peptidase I n=1 Tax=Streptomyces TaxID=1883 RepID=UPI001D1761D0|nr:MULTISPECIES: signal peptidase I [Streptomyces]MCX5035070.1 signal peptidase I [Streptomyces coelicoflavus]